MNMNTRPGRRLRCAIYTRNSSEEGLDMEFNSLDAQREACEAYISECFETGRNQRNRGAARPHLFAEMYGFFEPVSPGARGGWKETPGVRRPISRGWPVSEGRMVPANPFGT